MAYLMMAFEVSIGVFWVFGDLHDKYLLDRFQLFVGYAGLIPSTFSIFRIC